MIPSAMIYKGFKLRNYSLTQLRNQSLKQFVGRFDSSASAGDLLERVRALGFIAAIVRDALSEELIGR